MSVSIQSPDDFKKFFEDFFPAVYTFLLRYTREEELSRDFAQEAFIKVYEKRDEICSVEHARAFLYTIARHLYWDHRKHQRIEEQFLARGEQGDEGDEYNFLKEVTRQETIRVLYAAVNKLPPQTRSVILLRLQGKSSLDVSRELNISINTVKSLKKSAYATLRSLLSRDHFLLLLILIAD
jgi:RNA polymerase sigma-70 factor (ECF subfamily)